jgi:hypothetical protein
MASSFAFFTSSMSPTLSVEQAAINEADPARNKAARSKWAHRLFGRFFVLTALGLRCLSALAVLKPPRKSFCIPHFL